MLLEKGISDSDQMLPPILADDSEKQPVERLRADMDVKQAFIIRRRNGSGPGALASP